MSKDREQLSQVNSPAETAAGESAVENSREEIPKVAAELDACGLFCPEPVMLLHNKIRDLEVGEVLSLVATDSSTQRDVPKFCLYLGHELLQKSERQGRFHYLIRKSPPQT